MMAPTIGHHLDPQDIWRISSIPTWLICIGGRLHTLGGLNGMVELWLRLDERYSKGTNTKTIFQAHNDNHKDLAELIWRCSPFSVQPVVHVFAYSWGGAAAMRLAEALEGKGIPVQVMVLSDPVYKHWFYVGNWRALIGDRVLEVPANVKEVYSYLQEMNRPRGHRLIAADPEKTLIHEPTKVHRKHEYMDDMFEFHQFCMDIAGRDYPQEPKPISMQVKAAEAKAEQEEVRQREGLR